ncbi:hypothetical protein [Ramlibacter sp.]
MAFAAPFLRRALLAAPIAVALPPVHAAEPVPMAAVPAGNYAWSAADVELSYLPADPAKPGPGQLRGAVEVGPTRLRTSVRVDPAAERRRIAPVEASWELPASGPLQNLVLGDSYATGAGWSAPTRLTGVRFGRGVALRAPLRADDTVAVAPRAFAGTPSALGEASASRLPDASRLIPAAAVPAAPKPADPAPLGAGATDYEVEVGRLREGWDDPDRTYLGKYGAAAYRAGLGHGLTAEARTEWTGALNARGLELLQDVGGGATLRAVAAQSEGDQGSGRRWGLGVVRQGPLTWRMAYAVADRDFRSGTGAVEAREALRVGTSVPLGRRASADLSYARKTTWDVATPTSTIALTTRLALGRATTVSFDMGREDSLQPAWRAGASIAFPLDAPAPGRP